MLSKLVPPVTVLIEFEIESVGFPLASTSLYTSSLFTATGSELPEIESFAIVIVSPFSNVTTTVSFATTANPSTFVNVAVYTILPLSSPVVVVAVNTTFTTSVSSVMIVFTLVLSATRLSKLVPPVTVLIAFEIESVGFPLASTSLYTSSLFTSTGSESAVVPPTG